MTTKKRPKLQNLKPRLNTLGSRLSSLPSTPNATPRLRGRAGVERRARWLAKHPLCKHCEAKGETTMAAVVDHVTPLWQGGPDNEGNFQSLCKPHHDAKTAREAAERAAGG